MLLIVPKLKTALVFFTHSFVFPIKLGKFLYHNRIYRDFVTFISLCHVGLGVLEGRDNAHVELKVFWWLELSFCVIYILDSMMVLKFIGKERWLKQEVWIFVLSIVVSGQKYARCTIYPLMPPSLAPHATRRCCLTSFQWPQS